MIHVPKSRDVVTVQINHKIPKRQDRIYLVDCKVNYADIEHCYITPTFEVRITNRVFFQATHVSDRELNRYRFKLSGDIEGIILIFSEDEIMAELESIDFIPVPLRKIICGYLVLM